LASSFIQVQAGTIFKLNAVRNFRQVGEFEYYRDLLWTAPELLRMSNPPLNGTQKADVYSFAIIAQQIVFKAAPFFIDDISPECTDIIWLLHFLY